jgi:hypothetical protein
MKRFSEMLKGNQHKIDANKNGKVDSHDFKLLRKMKKEETETGCGCGCPKCNSVTMEETVYEAAPFKDLKSATDYASGKVKTHRDPDDGIEIYKHKSGGYDVNHTMNSSGRNSLRSAGAKHLGTVYKDKPHNIKEAMHKGEGKVETKKYSWGTMKTVHHGSEFSVPLHPEHHQAIAKLKDNQEHKFKDETGRHWTAKRMGDKVHLHGANNGGKTVVNHSDLKEETGLDEKFINGREYASQGVMHPDHAKMDIHKVSGKGVDFYASKTGDKMHGVVKKNDGKEVHIQAHKELGDGKLHKFKVTSTLPKSQNEEVEIDEGIGSAVVGAVGIVKNVIKKEKEYQAQKQKKAGEVLSKMRKEESELDEKMNMSKADMGDVIKDFQKSDAPQFAGKSKEKRRQMAIAAKLQADRMKKEGVEMKSYKQFMEELYTKLPEETELDEVAKASGDLKDACWKGYTAVGMKMKDGKKVPNCVPVKEEEELDESERIDELDINLLKSMQKHAKANPRPKSSSDDAIDPKTGRLKPYGYRGKSEYEKSETGDDEEPKKRGRKAGSTVGSYKRRQPK